jgi:hypothetical protein
MNWVYMLYAPEPRAAETSLSSTSSGSLTATPCSFAASATVVRYRFLVNDHTYSMVQHSLLTAICSALVDLVRVTLTFPSKGILSAGIIK